MIIKPKKKKFNTEKHKSLFTTLTRVYMCEYKNGDAVAKTGKTFEYEREFLVCFCLSICDF